MGNVATTASKAAAVSSIHGNFNLYEHLHALHAAREGLRKPLPVRLRICAFKSKPPTICHAVAPFCVPPIWCCRGGAERCARTLRIDRH
jgi:hypothetical protein